MFIARCGDSTALSPLSFMIKQLSFRPDGADNSWASQKRNVQFLIDSVLRYGKADTTTSYLRDLWNRPIESCLIPCMICMSKDKAGAIFAYCET